MRPPLACCRRRGRGGVRRRHLGAAEETAASLGGDHAASAVVCDVADPIACREAVAHAVEVHGRLDVLAHVAGVAAFGHTAELAPEEWEHAIAVNLNGTFFMGQAALGPLLETRGAIVNMASAAGLRATPYNAAYYASKGGVVMLTRSLAVELATRACGSTASAPARSTPPSWRGVRDPRRTSTSACWAAGRAPQRPAGHARARSRPPSPTSASDDAAMRHRTSPWSSTAGRYGRDPDSASTRDKLLDAAAALFAERGIHNVLAGRDRARGRAAQRLGGPLPLRRPGRRAARGAPAPRAGPAGPAPRAARRWPGRAIPPTCGRRPRPWCAR